MPDPITYSSTPRPREDLLRPIGGEHVWIATAVHVGHQRCLLRGDPDA